MTEFFARMGPDDTMIVLVVTVVGATVVLIGVPALLFTQWRKLREAGLETELKRDMLARGMSAEEVVRVVHASRPESDPGEEVPSTTEAVVEQGGDWYPAIVLKRAGTRWFIHYVGYDTSENEWVTLDRIRFPLGFFESQAASADEPLAGHHPANDVKLSSPKKETGVGLDL